MSAAGVIVGMIVAGCVTALAWLIADILMADPRDYWNDDEEEGR